MQDFPGVDISFQRMGLSPGLSSFAVTGLRTTAGGAADISIDSLSVRYSLLPILRGKLFLGESVIDGIRAAIDLTEPVPDCLRTAKPPVPPLTVETKALKSAIVTNVSASVRGRSATNSPVFTVTLTNFVLRIERDQDSNPTVPFSFSGAAAYRFDQGTNQNINMVGRCNLDAKTASGVNMDVDLAAKSIPLPDLNPILAGSSPFLVRTGTMDFYFNMCCRNGKLAGITSIKTSGVTLLHNSGSVGTGFLRLSFDAWRFLAQQRNGNIEADCNISGTIDKPVVPIGTVLRDQAVGAGRNMGMRVVEAIPTSFTRNLAAKWDRNESERDRYDNILKVSRLDKSEQHYEKGRHYREIVRNYNLAVAEFMLQASEYPDSAELAVRALIAAAEIQRSRMHDLPAAIDALNRVVQKYSNHADADDAMLEMIGMSVELKRYPDANVLCNRFKETFKHSEHAAKVAEIQKSISDMVW
jgi:hypothetical protein